MPSQATSHTPGTPGEDPCNFSNRELLAISLAGGIHSFINLLGPAGIAFIAQIALTVENALLLYAVCLVFAAGTVFLTREVPSSLVGRRLILNVALVTIVAAVLGTAAISILSPTSLIAQIAFAPLLGGSLGLTSKYHFDMFQAVRQTRGERSHMFVIAGSGLISGLMFLACIFSTLGQAFAAGVLMVGAVVSWVIYYRLAPKTCRLTCDPVEGKPWKTPPKLLIESAARGVASSTALCLVLYAGFGQDGSTGLLVCSAAGALAIPCLLTAYIVRQQNGRPAEGLAYGHTLRLFVVTLGAGMALIPLAKSVPAAVCFICFLTMQFNACLTPFNIANLCHSENLPARVVLPPMYAVNALSSCTGVLIVALSRNLGGETLGYEVAAFVGVLAALSFVPMLPARRSAISVMVPSVLPEDERPEDRIARFKKALVENKVLTTREGEVFELLLANRTRKEIAETLCISTSTVKNHTTSVYEKLGVHAQHELVQRVLHGEDEAGRLDA